MPAKKKASKSGTGAASPPPAEASAPSPIVANAKPIKAPAKPPPKVAVKAPAAPAAKVPAKPGPVPAKSAPTMSVPAKAPLTAPKAGKPLVAPKPLASTPPAKAAKPAAPPKKAAPPAPPKPPTRARVSVLEDLGDPDDDDLDDDEDAKPATLKVAADDDEEDDEAPILAIEPVDVEPAASPALPKRVTPRVVPPLPPRKPGVVTVAFSPDADDAFMLYGLAHGKVDTEGRRYEFLRSDVASLNDEALKGTYDVTAFSFGAWPRVVERYLTLSCGGCFGDHVGPILVSKTPVRSNEVDGLVIAVPGLSTTATLVLRLWLPRARLKLVPMPFDKIGAAVKSGSVRAGLLIHEGQLTYKAEGLARVIDLGQWWGERTEGLPLPLGGTAIRRDIPVEERTKVSLDLKRSIAYGLGHREEALVYAAQFGRGLPPDLLDKYVSMYVNELTLDYGERGRQAVHALYDEAVRQGQMKERVELDFG